MPDMNSDDKVSRRGFLRGVVALSVIVVQPEILRIGSNVSPLIAPSGVVYEWKRLALHGHLDEAYVRGLLRSKWRFVPPERHPGVDVVGFSKAVRSGGLALMEKDAGLVAAVRDAEREAANAQLLALARTYGAADFTTLVLTPTLQVGDECWMHPHIGREDYRVVVTEIMRDPHYVRVAALAAGAEFTSEPINSELLWKINATRA